MNKIISEPLLIPTDDSVSRRFEYIFVFNSFSARNEHISEDSFCFVIIEDFFSTFSDCRMIFEDFSTLIFSSIVETIFFSLL